MAERSVFSTSRATDFLVKRRMERASLAFLPRMSWSTRPAFWAEVRRYLLVAFTSSIGLALRGAGAGSRSAATARTRARSARDLGHLLDLARVPLELPGGRELAELVADHVLRHVDGDELLAVVDGQGVADHLRGDGGAARPGLDDLAFVGRVHGLDLLHQVIVDERALLQ